VERTGDDRRVDNSSWGDDLFVERDVYANEEDLALGVAFVDDRRATAVFGWVSGADVAAV
jgi:hypothetical protein